MLVPDKFWGGIVGAFLAAVIGALASGYVLAEPGVSSANQPGLQEGPLVGVDVVPASALGL